MKEIFWHGFPRLIYTQRNKNATLFLWKIHGLMFKVLDRENEQACFQETIANLTKHCLDQLSIKKKHVLIRIMSVSAYVSVSYF